MSDAFTSLLSEHLDGDLPPSKVRALERHLETCPECRQTLTQLQAVKDRARALVDPPAPDDLWAGIATRIGTAGSTGVTPSVLALPRRGARLAWLVPAAAAAAAVVLLLGGRHFARQGATQTPPVAQAPAATTDTTQLATFDPAQIDGEVAQLQRSLDRGRGKLDPKTVAVLEKNLRLISAATADARRALAADPANRELQDYFAATMRGKLQLMRRAAAMAGA